jgi:DNA polymerase-3 subunit delta'
MGTLTSRFVEFNREEQKGVFKQAFKLVRDSIVYRYGSADLLRLPEDRKEIIKRLSTKVSLEKAEAIHHVLNQAMYHLERNANDRLTFFDTTLQLHSLLG